MYIGYIIFLLVLSTPAIFSNKFEIKQQEYYDITVSVIGKKMNGRLGKHITINNLSNKCYDEHCGLPRDGNYAISKINFIIIEGKIFIYYFCLKENTKCIYNITEKFIERQKDRYIRDAKFVIIGSLVAFFASLVISFLTFNKRRS